MNAREFGQYLRERRKALEMTQTEVAEKIGMSQTNYAKYERGAIETMSTRTLGKLSIILNIPHQVIIELVMSLSVQTDTKKPNLDLLRDNPPRKYAANSSVKVNDDDAEYLRKQLEEINEEEAKGDWE